MTDRRTTSPFVLIGKYVQGTLTDDEARMLLEQIENNFEIARLLYKNVQTDICLNRYLPSEKESNHYLADLAKASGLGNEPVEPGHGLWSSDRLIESSYDGQWDKRIILTRDNTSTRPIIIKALSEPESPWPHLPRRMYAAVLGRKGLLRTGWGRGVFALFLLTAITVLVVLLVTTKTGHDTIPDSLARVCGTVDAVWEDGAVEYRHGQRLDACQLRLKSGLVQLEMDNGTRIVLEGPADLTLNSNMVSFCQSGSMSVAVSREANGYEVTTPSGRVVDRGTEFFLNVLPEGTLVELVQGKVDYFSMAKVRTPLQLGQAMAFDSLGRSQKVNKSSRINYISTSQFEIKAKEKTKEILSEKKKSYAVMDADPNLLVRLFFAEAENAMIPNHSETGKSFCSGARILGTEPAEGSLLGTTSLGFRNSQDQVTFEYPGSFDSLTLIATVQLDNSLQLGNVLFSSRNEDEQSGMFLWQISNLGFQQVQISTDQNNASTVYNSDAFFQSNVRGIWCQPAVVFDHKEREIRFYIDGRLVSKRVWEKPVPLNIVSSVVGNTRLNRMKTSRNFNGAMEEFMLFDRAMTGTEIRKYTFLPRSEEP